MHSKLELKIRFKKNSPSKKASVSMSVEAIVAIILAVLFLGAFLLFLEKPFTKATSEFGSTMDSSISRQESDTLTGSMKLKNSEIDLSTLDLAISPGEKGKLLLGIKNNQENAADFSIKIDCISAISAESLKTSGCSDWIKTFQKQNIRSMETAVIPIIVDIPPTAKQTTYSYELSITAPGNFSRSINFYLTVE